jgi:hypothetical protein
VKLLGKRRRQQDGLNSLVLYATPLSEAFLCLASRLLSKNTAQRLAGQVSE